MWDALLAAWLLRCPERDALEPIGLADFRRVVRLDGPSHPPVHRVAYACPCGDRHEALVTEPELDWDPVRTPPPVHFDLQLGRDDWAADALEDRWLAALRRDRWPLRLPCRHQGSVRAAWPSLVRAVEPGSADQLLVTYRCAGCERVEASTMHRAQLVFAPPAAA